MTSNVAIRPYADDDERGWLECRVLAFLDSAYYDAGYCVTPARGR
jgi:hypothetical protein